MIRKLVTAAGTGLVIAALSLSGTAFADSGASACQPAAGQQTAATAQALGGIGAVASDIATSQPGAIAALNQQSLFNCAPTP